MTAPILDPLGEAARAAVLLARAAAHLPGWQPHDGDPGTAVTRVFARFSQALAERLNQAPDKMRLAFYDRLGLSLLPAQPARAPLSFRPLAGAGDSRVPAGTRVGARIPERSEPVVFETETAVALAAAHLVEVVSLVPGRDAFADHSAAAVRGDAFVLFDGLGPVPHVLYISHPVHLALTGRSRVEVEIELASVAALPLDVRWEYWDGALWREFAPFVDARAATDADSVDGTLAWTRSGTVRLVSPCARTATTTVAGVSGRWLRCRLVTPLPPRDGDTFPGIARLSLRTVIDRALPATTCAALAEGVGLLPDNAFADGTRLDLTRAVRPLGAVPVPGNAWYMSLEEAFTRPGAEVELCFHKLVTPEEDADQKAQNFEQTAMQAPNYVIECARRAAEVVLDLIAAAREEAIPFPFFDPLQGPETQLMNARDQLAVQGLAAVPTVRDAVIVVIQVMAPIIAGLTGPVPPPGIGLVAWLVANNGRQASAKTSLDNAAAEVLGILQQLSALTPYGTAVATGVPLPLMIAPQVAWEYWNGDAWKPLPQLTGAAATLTLQADGPLRFVVPDDLDAREVNGVDARWIRARLVNGGYGISRMVSWTDEMSKKVNYMALLLHRPPTIDHVRLGYVWRSRRVPAAHCFSHNDFLFQDRTVAAAGGGASFPVFEPVADRTPGIYFGFDRTLPADALGLYLGAAETSEPPEVALVWETWDGAAWIPVEVQDQTRHLTLPGIATLSYPGVPALPTARVASAVGASVVLADRADESRFSAGDVLHLRAADGAGELARAAGVADGRIALALPLQRSYSGGSVSLAALPRFGTPRSWVRARFATDAPARPVAVARVQTNAVWAVQSGSYEREVLGSGTGEPDQVAFGRHAPLLEGEVVEVRELSGPRAEVELPVLRDELQRLGFPDEDLRTVVDPRSGRVSEAWVRWRSRPSLLFADAGERAYGVERSRGRLSFGGIERGRAAPAGADNLMLARYHAGGGQVGNLRAPAIREILAGVLAEGVVALRDAEGGADSEPLGQVPARGAAFVRHRRQAITLADYEALAREASPGVAAARALGTTDSRGRRAAGAVTVFILPQSGDPRPEPSFELRQRVRAFIAARAPAAVASALTVTAPRFVAVGVDATLLPLRPDDAGSVRAAALLALAAFLQPVSGGPQGRGWPFGRDVYASDLARILEHVAGMDAVTNLVLTVDGTAVGDVARVEADRLVVAGPLELRMHGGPR